MIKKQIVIGLYAKDEKTLDNNADISCMIDEIEDFFDRNMMPKGCKMFIEIIDICSCGKTPMRDDSYCLDCAGKILNK